jgi:regulator of replication initiation timing
MDIQLPTYLSLIIGVATSAGIIVAGFGYGYGQFKKGQNQSDDETIASYERQIDAFRSELDNICKKTEALEIENKGLHAQMNQLIGENKALKEVVVKPDSEFKKTVEVILEELKVIAKHQEVLAQQQANARDDFLKHSENDDKRFKSIGEIAKQNNVLLKKLISKEAIK